ncbi:hypothetical protein [Mycobacterium sp. AZCC_0083]|uniref:hypothetical protein n=1 Tax=Mycobacterium sp. AZCC_0083 TaxID=2735882 RepID=UPI00160F12BD|nr:hypothetical protein [Mycobacterium sp. AZCC_0083]MBB5164153.1 hypothetical protein [Mycobacterium sp. AZCC_0083]
MRHKASRALAYIRHFDVAVHADRQTAPQLVAILVGAPREQAGDRVEPTLRTHCVAIAHRPQVDTGRPSFDDNAAPIGFTASICRSRVCPLSPSTGAK